MLQQICVATDVAVGIFEKQMIMIVEDDQGNIIVAT